MHPSGGNLTEVLSSCMSGLPHSGRGDLHVWPAPLRPWGPAQLGFVSGAPEMLCDSALTPAEWLVPWRGRRSCGFCFQLLPSSSTSILCLLCLWLLFYLLKTCVYWRIIALQYYKYVQQRESAIVKFSGSVVSDSLRPHGRQHARPPCPSLSPEFAQTHVHRVGDATQPSHPLSPPSPPALYLSQHQGLFQGVSSTHQVATGLHLPKFRVPLILGSDMNLMETQPVSLTRYPGQHGSSASTSDGELLFQIYR